MQAVKDIVQFDKCHHGINIEFSDLRYSVTRRKGVSSVRHDILKGISGSFKSGRLTGIIGASGAGKTTLLNVLSGFRTHEVTGTVLVNGHERNVSRFRKSSCYISQNSALMPCLTAEETLLTAADLKFGTYVTKTRKKSLVNEVLKILGLTKAKDTLVGKLSGGEQKRLSVGVELLTNPSIMFFDEPTSGLDSVSSLQMVSYLKSLARAGRTVICTIHQPSSRIFEMFDDIYLLADGQCLYSGPLDELTNVLEAEGFTCPKYYNRADFALQVSCKDTGIDNLIKRFKTGYLKSHEALNTIDTQKKILKEDNTIEMQMLDECNCERTTTVTKSDDNFNQIHHHSSPLYYQWYILTKRSMICTYRNLYLGTIRFFTHVLVGALFGILCYDIGNDATKVATNIGFIFLLTLFLFGINPGLTVLCFPMEATVFLQEYHNNWYSLKAYFLAKIISELPLQVICSTVFVFIAYFFTGQPYDNLRPLKFWGLCLIISICGQSMGFALGALFDVQISFFLTIALNIPMGLFSGFVIRTKDISKYFQWAASISFHRFTFDAGLLIMYDNRSDLECSEVYCHFKSPSMLLKEFSLTERTLEINYIGLLLWIIVFQVVFFLSLKWRTYISK